MELHKVDDSQYTGAQSYIKWMTASPQVELHKVDDSKQVELHKVDDSKSTGGAT